MKRAPATSESASRRGWDIEEKRANDDSDPNGRGQTDVESELVLKSELDLTDCDCPAPRENDTVCEEFLELPLPLVWITASLNASTGCSAARCSR